MKVKFLSVIGLDLSLDDEAAFCLLDCYPREPPAFELIANGLPTRQARAVLFYLREPERCCVRELLLEAEDTVDVLRPLPIPFASFMLSSAGAAGLIALITRSESVLLLLFGRVTRGLRKHSSMPWSSSFRF